MICESAAQNQLKSSIKTVLDPDPQVQFYRTEAGPRNLYYEGEPPPKHNYLREGRPLIIQASPLGQCSRNPSVPVYQLVLWEAAFSFSGFFLKTLSTQLSWFTAHLPTHECSAVFDQKWHDPRPHPPYSPWVTFFGFLSEKSPQREMFCWRGRGETKIQQKH